MSKFTRGPWKAEAPISANGWWVIIDSAGHELGSCDGGYDVNDARLIAAAPEMYEALRKLLDSPNTFASHDKAAAQALLARIDGDA